MKALVLLSGGIDSVTALHDAARGGLACGGVSFDYGAKHGGREIPCAAWQCARLGLPHRVIRLDAIGAHFASGLLVGGGEIPDGHYEEESMRQTVVPFRNGILLAVAAGLAESEGAEALLIAAHAGDHAIYPDCRPGFMEAMGEAIRLGTYAGIRLLRPFLAMSKADIVARGHALGVDFSRTWSCYKGGEIHCGTCGTCVERREAFARAGVADPTDYLAEPPLPGRPPVDSPAPGGL